ncbi:spore germination protein GerW family protein [Streptomyces sp. CC219B]|uniref:spore germination protein GerW family protein n=1 Tax=Streptomyces sp. CC219B TaxID=3044574 RepID=UPI0024A8A6FF|nr:spore germination protein GerW family protein [Streptomyces sp. CC219B]
MTSPDTAATSDALAKPHATAVSDAPTPSDATAVSDAPTPSDATAAQASATLLERLADKLGARASVTTVFGEPVTSGGVTVIPVADVGFGFGGGAGREIGAVKSGEGGGGGGGAGARARGFIEIKDGTATYKPLRDPWVDVVVPVAALLAGAVLPRLVRRRRAR